MNVFSRSVRGSRLDAQTAEALAREDWNIIEAHVCRHSFAEVQFGNISLLKNSKASEGPRLSELPGFTATRDWVSDLATDLASWNAKTLEWSAVDRGALLIGPLGVGKTMFATALAAGLGIALVATSAGQWQSSGDGYPGEMLRAMRGRLQ